MENTSNLLIEEREEVMVSEKSRCLRKAHFLKPFVTSINGGSVSKLPRRDSQRFSDFSLELKRFSSQITFSGFWFAERHFISWVVKMEALHASTWQKAGIFEAIKASTYNITRNPSMILSIAEKWCPETKSFVFPWGEATITLEDVMVLLGFSVLGSPVLAPLKSSEMRDAVERLEKERLKNRTCGDKSGLREGSWISCFLGRGGQMEHEAFLVLWLSLFVFPSLARRGISIYVTPIAVRLARGERIALAPVVLATLYRDLGRICDFSRDKCAGKVHLKSLFKLVQVWTWERFRNTRPKARVIPKGEPRISQWDTLTRKYQNARLSFDDFDWRPYTEPLKNWNPLRLYREEAMWVTVDESIDDEFASFARCVTVSQLVGGGFVEDYFPDRVARQFGLAHDLPGLVTRHRNFTEKEAWDDYGKSLDGLRLYIPSRLDRGSVTARYRVWWLKSVSEFLGSVEMQKESNNARNTFNDHDDGDIDVSPKILPLPQVIQKLELGFPVKRRRSKMRRIAKKCKIGELMNSLVSSGWKMNKTSGDLTKNRSSYKALHIKTARENGDKSSMDEEDDNMTIAQLIRSQKKYSDAEKTGGDASKTLVKRTRRYMTVESDDSGPCQKPVSIKTEQRSEEDDETASKAQKTRRILDDFEVNVNGNTAAKESMTNDEQQDGSIMQNMGRNEAKKAEYLVNEDGEKQRCIEELCSEVKKQEEIDERLRQRKLAIKEIELNLEARIVKMEKTLAMIRKWKTRGKQIKIEVSA